MSGVSGDFDKLDLIRSRLGRLSGLDVQLASKVAAPISGAARSSFNAQQTPYGEAWENPNDLVRTGALRAGATTYSPQGRRLKASMPKYGRYNNPPQFLPSSKQPPPAWEDIVKDAVPDVLADVVGVK